MSSCVDVSSEQLCYIPCNFCNIVLAKQSCQHRHCKGSLPGAVSVPCSSLFDIVTVRCGHCANLWSVNMAASAFHSFSPSSWQQQQQHPHHPQQQLPHPHQLSTSVNPSHHMRMENANLGSRYYGNKAVGGTMRPAPGTSSSSDHSVSERVVNRPPEKRQRVPSAYNQFIKEEIQRIKANNPDISHREAFSTAAKNWAHFPHIHFGLMLDNNNQAKHSEARTTLLN